LNAYNATLNAQNQSAQIYAAAGYSPTYGYTQGPGFAGGIPNIVNTLSGPLIQA
jgi:hypothetical protein